MIVFLLGSEEATTGAVRADAYAYRTEAAGAAAFVGGGGMVAIKPLIDGATLKEDADIGATAGAGRRNLDLGDTRVRRSVCAHLIADLQNVIRVIGHNEHKYNLICWQAQP